VLPLLELQGLAAPSIEQSLARGPKLLYESRDQIQPWFERCQINALIVVGVGSGAGEAESFDHGTPRVETGERSVRATARRLILDGHVAADLAWCSTASI
jgi:hypothetical protein